PARAVHVARPRVRLRIGAGPGSADSALRRPTGRADHQSMQRLDPGGRGQSYLRDERSPALSDSRDAGRRNFFSGRWTPPGAGCLAALLRLDAAGPGTTAGRPHGGPITNRLAKL